MHPQPPRPPAILAAALCLASLLPTAASAADPNPATPPTFRKVVLNPHYYADGINAADIDGDGDQDIIAGPFIYLGPDFKSVRHFYLPVRHPTAPSPTNSMFTYIHDFDGDRRPDILRLGRVHKHEARWFLNPGAVPEKDKDLPWKTFPVTFRVKGESPPFADVDGDGSPEIVTHWETHWGLLKPVPGKPEAEWSRTPVTTERKWEQFYHGTGVGDIDGDGRTDIVLNDGWWRQPSEAAEKGKPWGYHPARFGDKGGAQIGVFDVDGDGDNDVVSALNAHGFGLSWFEQTRSAAGSRVFTEHKFMGDRSEEEKFGVCFSQVHALAYADVDGDGLTDIVTGKRRWAHGPDGDVEPAADPVVYWFQLIRDDPVKGTHFRPHLVDRESGVGVQITAKDVTGDGLTDILTASKLGAFLFVQERRE